MRCSTGIADGSVDVIATDHAPHHIDEKMVEFDRAPFGIVGLETAVPIVFDRLVRAGRISLKRMIELLSVNPARVLNLRGGRLDEGAPADITVLAPDLADHHRRRQAGLEIQEHAVRSLASDRRRGRHHRWRKGRLSQCRC